MRIATLPATLAVARQSAEISGPRPQVLHPATAELPQAVRAAPAHAALTAGRAHPVEVSAMIRNVTLVDASQRGAAVAVEDSGNALLDNIVIAGDRQSGLGVVYGIRADEQFGHLRIRNVVAPAVGEAGIALVNLSQSGGLDSYTIMKNVATVGARMPTPKWLVEGNL